METYSEQLVTAVDRVIGPWIERCVVSVARTQGLELRADDRERVTRAVDAARRDVHERLIALLDLDVDAQRGNPLDVLRGAVVHPTAVLRELGAQPIRRDEFAERLFPDDVYGLSPAAFADVDESLVEPGIIWGAWKAKTVLERRRSEGRLAD